MFTRVAEFDRGLHALRRVPPDPVETPVPDPTAGVTDPVTDPAPTLLPDPIEVPSLPPLP